MGPLGRINLSSKGASFSFGVKGARMNFGSQGVRMTAGIPGTGLSYSTKLGSGGSSMKSTAGELDMIVSASASLMSFCWAHVFRKFEEALPNHPMRSSLSTGSGNSTRSTSVLVPTLRVEPDCGRLNPSPCWRS